jgi:hypothetical protein
VEQVPGPVLDRVGDLEQGFLSLRGVVSRQVSKARAAAA